MHQLNTEIQPGGRLPVLYYPLLFFPGHFKPSLLGDNDWCTKVHLLANHNKKRKRGQHNNHHSCSSPALPTQPNTTMSMYYHNGRHLELPQENEASKALMKELLENRTEGPIVLKSKQAEYSKSGALSHHPLDGSNYKTTVVAKRFTKKKKQLKLKQSIQRNFQKYPISRCMYDPSLQKHVYLPSKWKKQVSKTEFDYASCCPHCYLRPCVTECKKVSFIECMKESFVVEPQHVSRNARVQAIMIFKEFCGELWMDRMKFSWSPTIIEVPACVNKAIPRFTEQARAELDDKEEEDEEETDLSEEEESEFEL